MKNQKQLLDLRKQYIQCSQQYFQEMNNGKTTIQLKPLIEKINDLLNQIGALEQQSGVDH